MCGIVGYIGPQDATPIILNGLKRLEYRGYDSAGLAVLQTGISRCAVTLASSTAWHPWCVRTRSRASGHWAYPLGHPRKPSARNAHPHIELRWRSRGGA
jgi:glutamine---fructose-6-phosphate transaminase (isomerizing)